jgi:hypothetical protein
MWFLAGCAFAAIITLFLASRVQRSAASQNAVYNAQVIGQLRGEQAELIKERGTCMAKFDRVTVLHDVGLFNVETKAWAVPADVEPEMATGKNGTYSHYDPKTQIETVHFRGKAAQ